MKQSLRILSAVLALTAASAWLVLGANRGWTRTSVANRTMDEVTGIEGIQYQARFVPGVDFLGGALLLSGLAASASFFVRNQTT
jgi:hypothetical protein